MILQLSPPIPVFIPPSDNAWPSGGGYCLGWIDYSQEHATLWKVAFDEDGKLWDIPQPFVRLQKNASMERA